MTFLVSIRKGFYPVFGGMEVSTERSKKGGTNSKHTSHGLI